VTRPIVAPTKDRDGLASPPVGMRVVIDGIPISGASIGIVAEHLLGAWAALDLNDELHLVVGPDADIDIPSSVHVHHARYGRSPFVSRLWAQSAAIPRICRDVKADIMLGIIPTTTVTPLPCPRAVIAYDVRHELRPEQFARQTRLAKQVGYGVGFHQADAVACISERTRRDLLAGHPRLRRRIVDVALLGADHVASWPVHRPAVDYAVAFGQYGNKNVQLVLQGWAALHGRGDALPLVIVGLSPPDRTAVESTVTEMGLSDVVSALPWLPAASFKERFASASVIVFPSEFEGFGLPAVEAMWLGIPLVISKEPALLEVTAGHATEMERDDAEALASAVSAARHMPAGALEAAQTHAATFTWRATATHIRDMLEKAIAARHAKDHR
jgi:glycosyltransferase involved in cell wall biosynthesis